MSEARPFEYLSLVDAQQDITGRILADAYFGDLTVINDRMEDIGTEISKGLGLLGAQTDKKLGACVIVLQPVANYANANAVAGPMDVLYSLRVLENPTLNEVAAGGSGKQGLHIARRIVDVLALYQAIGLATALAPQKPCIVPVEDPTGAHAYEVRFGAREAGGRAIQKCALPTITIAVGGITLYCATPECDIWYTTDSTHPWRGNPTATLWDGTPFAPDFDSVIRACAFKRSLVGTDWIASDVNSEPWFRELATEKQEGITTEDGGQITV